MLPYKGGLFRILPDASRCPMPDGSQNASACAGAVSDRIRPRGVFRGIFNERDFPGTSAQDRKQQGNAVHIGRGRSRAVPIIGLSRDPVPPPFVLCVSCSRYPASGAFPSVRTHYSTSAHSQSMSKSGTFHELFVKCALSGLTVSRAYDIISTHLIAEV